MLGRDSQDFSIMKNKFMQVSSVYCPHGIGRRGRATKKQKPVAQTLGSPTPTDGGQHVLQKARQQSHVPHTQTMQATWHRSRALFRHCKDAEATGPIEIASILSTFRDSKNMTSIKTRRKEILCTHMQAKQKPQTGYCGCVRGILRWSPHVNDEEARTRTRGKIRTTPRHNEASHDARQRRRHRPTSPTRGDPEPPGLQLFGAHSQRALAYWIPNRGVQGEPDTERWCGQQLHSSRARCRMTRTLCHRVRLRPPWGGHDEGPPLGVEYSPATPCLYGVSGRFKNHHWLTVTELVVSLKITCGTPRSRCSRPRLPRPLANVHFDALWEHLKWRLDHQTSSWTCSIWRWPTRMSRWHAAWWSIMKERIWINCVAWRAQLLPARCY